MVTAPWTASSIVVLPSDGIFMRTVNGRSGHKPGLSRHGDRSEAAGAYILREVL